MPIAADYPFLEVMWSMLVFVAFIMWIWLAIMVFADVFRRRDTSGFKKALWIVFVILIPYFGVLVYLIVNHDGISERSAKEAQAYEKAFDQRVKEAAGSAGPAGEIDTAKSLLDAGAISQEEFDRLKAAALAKS